jgi:hypothetical protein
VADAGKRLLRKFDLLENDLNFGQIVAHCYFVFIILIGGIMLRMGDKTKFKATMLSQRQRRLRGVDPSLPGAHK